MSEETVISLRVHGNIVEVESTSAVLGRSKNTDVQLDEQGISRRHCELLLRPGSLTVRDLGSTHGTFIDGRRVRGEERLRAGSKITMGPRGPSVEIVGAVLNGKSVFGAPPEQRPRTGTAVHLDAEPPTASVAAREALTDETPPGADAGAPPVRSRFVAGLVWGLIAGLVAGAAAVGFDAVP